MSDRILEALGAKDELEALRIIAEANQFLTDIKEATGRETFAASLSVIRNSVSFSREIQATTEKGEQESLGVVLAWKASHEQLPRVQEEVVKLSTAAKERDVENLCREGLAPAGSGEHGGKLTPAMADYWRERKDPEALAAFLKIAPRVIPAAAKQAAPVSPAADFVPALADGRKYEDIAPAERAKLKRNDAALYEAMHNDWLARGKPAASASAN